MQNAIIKLENVHKDYRMGESVVAAVNEINLEIKKGDFLAIVGPSGSGKSTMMNLVGALDFPNKGNVYLDNINIASMNESELASLRGKKIGFIFQNFNLVPTLTALENVMLPMMFQNYSEKERKEKSEKLLIEVGLRHRLSHLPKELSGGERQRVAIARALANNPEVILADEPTGNLDTKTGEEIIQMFIKLNKQGKTIIVVTHNTEIAKRANRVVTIKDGKIVGEKK